MIALPVLQSHQVPLRVMSLHAFGYCQRLFYLEEVEEIRVANAKVFAGRQLHAELEADEEGESTSLELSSESLGIMGKVDCLKRRDGSFLPYEHKRGKPDRDEANKPRPWPSDRLQIVAYAMLIEEVLGQPVPEGRIRYHKANVTVRVPIDDEARVDLKSAIEDARKLRDSLERPPIAENDRLCAHCSLAPVCLPEEVRQERQPERDPTRLFPPDRDGATVHVLAQGTTVGVSGDQLVIRPKEGEPVKRPLAQVESVLLHGFAQISTQAIRKCTEHEVSVHWLSMGGWHTASLTSSVGQVQRRIRQYQALTDEATCLRLTKALVSARVEGQLRYLLRGTRGGKESRATVEADLDAIREIVKRIPKATDRDSLRGLEGAAAVSYFRGMRLLLSESVPDELRSDHRNRRPPLDRFNALLSYGYGLLHTSVMKAVLASGLEPALGFFHTPRSAAHPLVLDLMELWRVPIWDMTMIGSLNRNQWQLQDDFVVTKTKVWLSEIGRKKAIELFESRLSETWKHPVLNYSLSYARSIELEARMLEKEWTGEPGLFARARLR